MRIAGAVTPQICHFVTVCITPPCYISLDAEFKAESNVKIHFEMVPSYQNLEKTKKRHGALCKVNFIEVLLMNRQTCLSTLERAG